MTTTVSFPGLGLEFELDRVAFSIGGFSVYWYGLLIGIGFLLAGAYAVANSRKVGVDGDRLIDVILTGLVCGIIGARLYYVAFSWEMFRDNPMNVFNIRMGGLAIYGGIIAGVLGGAVMARIRRVNIFPALDLAAAGFLIGQGIGRWGNFINVEAFGSNTTSIFGMTGPKIVGYLTQVKQSGAAWAQSIDPNLPVHPTFLYESVWCLTGFLIIALFLMRRRKFDGQVFLFYCIWYGAGRFFIEGLRTDSLMLGPVRVSQAFAALCVLTAGVLMAVILRKKKRLGEGFLPLYINTPEGQAVAAGTFYQTAPKPEIILPDGPEHTDSVEQEGQHGSDS
ncbi:MAG: prolipoprotein diacylglyceryl transferase [Clostridiales bacterium]|nr:prolipoprotein diacylglyceryl transferase [Clostridiales bacterium]